MSLETTIRSAIRQVAEGIRPSDDVLADVVQGATLGTHTSPLPVNHFLGFTVPDAKSRRTYPFMDLPAVWNDKTELSTIADYIKECVTNANSHFMFAPGPVGKCQRALYRIEREFREEAETLPGEIVIDDQEFRTGTTVDTILIRCAEGAYPLNVKRLVESSVQEVTDELRRFIWGLKNEQKARHSDTK